MFTSASARKRRPTIFVLVITLIFSILLLLQSACTPCQSCKSTEVVAPQNWEITQQNRALGKCMNLGNALEAPTEGAWGVVLKPGYFSHVKTLGFNSVRIPVRWSAHVASVEPYTIDEAFFSRVLWAVDQAMENNLRAIINVHHFEDLMSNPQAYSPVFLSIWQQVAKRCAGYGPELYFELCNEPNGAMTAQLWNDLAAKALAIVRQDNPTRSVILGPVSWNHAEALPDLLLPADSFLIATFHCYEPAPFTHQGASWVTGSDLWKGIRWRASRADTSHLKSLFGKVQIWADDKKLPVFLGEFGAHDTADSASRILYTSFVAKQALANGWSYAYWKYNNNFGIVDDATGTTRDYLVQALLSPDSTFTAWQTITSEDTTVTPGTGSGNYLLLDDFEDSLPRQSALIHCQDLFIDTSTPRPEASCYWNCWYKSGCMMKSGDGRPLAIGNEGVAALIGRWGYTGNGLQVKAYVKGDEYPTLNVSTSFPGIPLPGSYNKDGFDLSSMTAISFYAKGFGAWTIDIITDTIQNRYSSSDNWGNFSHPFEPGAAWKHYVVPVDEFKPKPWSKPQQEMLTWKDGMKKVCAITFSNSQNYGKSADDSLELFLDDICLFGLTCNNMKRVK